MIRAATDADIPALVALGKLMHAEAPEYRDDAYLPERAEVTTRAAIGMGACFVAEQDMEWEYHGNDDEMHSLGVAATPTGMILGIISDHWSVDRVVACDLVVYVLPEYRRGRIAEGLIRALEDAAREKGAKHLSLGISTGVHPERTEALYRALGYEQATVGFRKAL